MTGEPGDIERRDALAVVDLEAAVAVVTTTVGAMFGPIGAIAGALVGPYAKHAATRLIELRSRVEEAGVDTETLVGRLDENEALAHLIADVVRATVESDLSAKRALLARAAIRALKDDADVDVEERFVRAASEVDTVDVRVLAMIGQPGEPRPDPDHKDHTRAPGTVYPDELATRWPRAPDVAEAAVSTLIAAGLIVNAGIGTWGSLTFWKLTAFGRRFLDELRAEGLEGELRSRHGSE